MWELRGLYFSVVMKSEDWLVFRSMGSILLLLWVEELSIWLFVVLMIWYLIDIRLLMLIFLLFFFEMMVCLILVKVVLVGIVILVLVLLFFMMIVLDVVFG